jgi:archaellum biogenesis ATPase FlaH
MSSKRISTGIPELDARIEGGLRCGKTYLVVGEPGTGKTVFGLQFLVSGLMDKEKGLYVAMLTIEKMRSTALAPAQYIFNIMQDRGIVLLDSLLSARQSSPSESAPDDR